MNEQPGVPGNEPERNEFREPSRFFLYVSQDSQVYGPVVALVKVSVHYGRGGSHSFFVGFFHYPYPHLGRYLPGSDYLSYFLNQNLRRGTGEGVVTDILEFPYEDLFLYAERFSAVVDLVGRKSVGVHLRHGLFHRFYKLDVKIAVYLGVHASLHAYFRRAYLPGFHGSLSDFVHREKIRSFIPLIRHKITEAAVNIAYVSEVDVPVDDIGDHVPHVFLSYLVGGERESRYFVGILYTEKMNTVFNRDFLSQKRVFDYSPRRAVYPRHHSVDANGPSLLYRIYYLVYIFHFLQFTGTYPFSSTRCLTLSRT